jgi:hypothetical protein
MSSQKKIKNKQKRVSLALIVCYSATNNSRRERGLSEPSQYIKIHVANLKQKIGGSPMRGRGD